MDKGVLPIPKECCGELRGKHFVKGCPKAVKERKINPPKESKATKRACIDAAPVINQSKSSKGQSKLIEGVENHTSMTHTTLF